jgi:hypothetical protein
MSNIKSAYAAEQTLTVTNLHSLASSQTAGWQSAVVDNTSNLYLDALVQVVLDFANTAPANDKCAYVFAYAGLDTVYSDPASGSEGTITVPNVGANALNLRLIGKVNYTTTDAVTESAPMSVAAAFGGVLPPKWGLVIVNYSGAALAASLNTVKYRGVYSTSS